ncbi:MULTISPECIES: class C sortase [unclassified Bifidobacterium]|uniref:class C sortase n=1 Tax=unclassified Bifidobacterium TaxID=2608897 RepID=UPI0023F73E10|nr:MULTISPECIES: class C sortase [unclassified Bifidobacterium]WEV65735.1 class C sortase [Bifidobacterium sp. ESL0764]WEV75478.1 class C sortase [Bifidobacterium sp. ESL0800]
MSLRNHASAAGKDADVNGRGVAPSDPLALSFAQALRGGFEPKSRVKRIVIRVVDVLIVVCIVGFLTALAWFPVRWAYSMYLENDEIEASVDRISHWPQGKVAEEYHRAQAYNQRVAASGQPALGEFVDPFQAGKPGAKTESEKDSEYQSLLNTGDGIMGTIRIPKISVKLPIRHGTSDKVLEHGVGHLYGTSLPVGGASTNAVLSGHNGLTSALLFTRLDELDKGDIFYIQTLGRTMGYRVVGIHVIKPTDTHLYKVVPGKDLVTLMTCTPYGVNTERLIITGTRQAIPDPIPDPDDARGDGLLYGVSLAFLGLILGLPAVRLSHRKPWEIRHASAAGPRPPRRWISIPAAWFVKR